MEADAFQFPHVEEERLRAAQWIGRIPDPYTSAESAIDLSSPVHLSGAESVSEHASPEPDHTPHKASWLSSIFSIPQSRVMRVNQLDAEMLDKELTVMLGQQFRKIFKYMRSGFVGTWKPELDLFTRLLIYRFSVWVDRPSPGLLLMNLQYRNEADFPSGKDTDLLLADPSKLVSSATLATDEVFRLSRKQKLGYLLLAIGGRWAWTRLNFYMSEVGWSGFPEGSWQRRFFKFCHTLEQFYRLLYIGNFLVFLLDGRYRSIVERILKMRLMYMRSKVSRQISFEFMNQQLLWHGFSEFVSFILPLINFDAIIAASNKLVRAFSRNREQARGCPVCQADPITIAHIASCGHVFCYYCLRGSRLAERAFRCPQCRELITSQKPFSIDLGT